MSIVGHKTRTRIDQIGANALMPQGSRDQPAGETLAQS
jgi:hypothetical protein